MNYEFPDNQAGFRKGRGTRDQTAKIHWIIETARELQKNIYFYFINDNYLFLNTVNKHLFMCSFSSEGDGIPIELFQILKDDAVKMLYSICQQIWNTQQWPQDWKRSVFIPIPKKGNAKEGLNDHTTVLISHTSKVMLKFLQVRLQQYMN